MSLSTQIARWTLDQRYEAMDPAALAIARRAILDTLGCAVAGRTEPVTRIVRSLYAGPDATGVPLMTGDGWASPELAGLIGGAAAHALDFDDLCVTVTAHPSAVVVPTILAVGCALDRSGKDVLAAYLIGLEVGTRVGEVMGFTHYQLGWHPTMTLGVIGGAAAAGCLLGLSEEQLRTALGIAASLAGGLRRNFGTMTKPLHAGLGAQHGLRAALLAQAGLTADPDIFGDSGYYLGYGGGRVPTPKRLPLGEPLDLLTSGLAVKKFPCCYATHRLIDVIIGLAEEHDLNAPAVDRIDISAPPGAFAPLNRPRPTTGLEGKFSAEYTAAAALIDRRVTLASFADTAVLRPEAQSLLSRVTARELADPGTGVTSLDDGELTVRITLRDGALIEGAAAYPPGSPQRPLSDRELFEKFSDCLSVGAFPASAAERIFETGLGLERLDSVRSLLNQVTAAASR